ncbi:MAG: hypothetical protein U0175_13020 [Caldilineaceae bacterium]
MTSRSINGRFPRWATWLMAVITLLAVSILLLSIVLGLRAGQEQVARQLQQQIGMAVQQAIEYRAEGNYNAALEQYRIVLALDPNNPLATEGAQSMLTLLGTPTSSVALSATVDTPTTAITPSLQTTPIQPSTSVAVASSNNNNSGDKAALWSEAERALQAGRPQTTIDRLLQIRKSDPTFRPEELQTMLFNAYVQLASQQDSEDRLQESLLSLEHALELRPTATDVRREHDLLSAYLDMDSYYDTNWDEAIQLLESLKKSDPTYRDVSKRLIDAHVAYGDQILEAQPCDALIQYQAAVELVGDTPFIKGKESDAQLACTTFETAEALSGTVTSTVPSLSTSIAIDNGNAPLAATGDLRGRILYSSRDINDGRFHIFAQSAANPSAQPAVLADDAAQPALRFDGQRLAFHNLRNDLGGISSIDPGSGLQLQYTSFAEDVAPSWNANGGRLAFASTREGDRRWRIYMVWADQNSDATEVTFGEAPAWSPIADLLAYRGCDQTGNNCGIWQMDGSGSNRTAITTVQNDNRPDWSPDGHTLAFMSDGRSGNFDIFRIDTNTHQVTQLTDSPAVDLLPTVSPDGQWVAFASNRDGSWKIYVVSINGSAARLVAPIRGDFGDWQSQKLDWVN